MRVIARGRAFSVLAVTSLGPGIGATSAIFSLINAIVQRPLPVSDPHALRIAEVIQADGPEQQFSCAALTRAPRRCWLVAELSGQSSTETVLVGARRQGGEPTALEPASLQLVAGDYFGVLQQRPQIGRLLDRNDNRAPGAHPVAVISDRCWSRRFGRRTSILDTELIVNGSPLVIVGVTAPGFFGDDGRHRGAGRLGAGADAGAAALLRQLLDRQRRRATGVDHPTGACLARGDGSRAVCPRTEAAGRHDPGPARRPWCARRQHAGRPAYRLPFQRSQSFRNRCRSASYGG